MGKTGKVVCIVQARMGSSRLPGKVMMPVLGEPMISHTLRRLKKCETIDETVLATSVCESDDRLSDYVKSIGIPCFRGNEDDVLERYVLANRKYGGDVVIRVTGDCPLIDPGIVDSTVRAFCANDADYTSLDKGTAMRGLDTEVFSAEALERTYKIVSKLEDFKNYKEHVTIYMYRHPEEFRIIRVPSGADLYRPYRLCVDEEDDFRLIEEIYNHFGNPYPTIEEIVEFLDKNPEIAFINRNVEQKKA